MSPSTDNGVMNGVRHDLMHIPFKSILILLKNPLFYCEIVSAL